MIITTRNLVQYFLAKGLVSHSSVVDGDFGVIDVSGRNRNYKVLRHNGPGFFVKQIQNWDPQAIAMLQCEAACYWLPQNDVTFSSLASITPDFISYDPERQVLITRLINNGEDFWEHYRRQGEISTRVAGTLGALLGAYHKGARQMIESSHNTIFPRQLPWILASERRNSHPFKQLSPATAGLFDHVENSKGLSAALDAVRDEWSTSTLMHGDLKLENCILSQSSDELQITIVDWELADIGDPCWDVGGILQSLISATVISLPESDSPVTILDLMVQAPSCLDSIGAFWKQYAANLEVDAQSSQELLARCLRYGAARMIQSAYEYMQFSPHISTNARHLLEVSESVLADPTSIGRSLLR